MRGRAIYYRATRAYNPIQEGCVLYLPLWHKKLEGDVIYSQDDYGHECDVTGAIWGVDGRTFDGSDDFIGLGTTISPFSALTIIVWVYQTSLDGSSRGWVARGDADTALNFMLYVNNGEVRFGVQGGTPTAAWANGFSADSWQQMACTITGTTLNFYNNTTASLGNPYTVLAMTANAGVSTMVGRGTAGAGFGKLWNGIIGDVILYNRVLSAAEIDYIYQNLKGRYS